MINMYSLRQFIVTALVIFVVFLPVSFSDGDDDSNSETWLGIGSNYCNMVLKNGGFKGNYFDDIHIIPNKTSSFYAKVYQLYLRMLIIDSSEEAQKTKNYTFKVLVANFCKNHFLDFEVKLKSGQYTIPIVIMEDAWTQAKNFDGFNPTKDEEQKVKDDEIQFKINLAEEERLAAIEAERLAKEEADLQAKKKAERQAKEEADRQAKEEEEQKKAKLAEEENTAKLDREAKEAEEENKAKIAEEENKAKLEIIFREGFQFWESIESYMRRMNILCLPRVGDSYNRSYIPRITPLENTECKKITKEQFQIFMDSFLRIYETNYSVNQRNRKTMQNNKNITGLQIYNDLLYDWLLKSRYPRLYEDYDDYRTRIIAYDTNDPNVELFKGFKRVHPIYGISYSEYKESLEQFDLKPWSEEDFNSFQELYPKPGETCEHYLKRNKENECKTLTENKEYRWVNMTKIDYKGLRQFIPGLRETYLTYEERVKHFDVFRYLTRESFYAIQEKFSAAGVFDAPEECESLLEKGTAKMISILRSNMIARTRFTIRK